MLSQRLRLRILGEGIGRGKSNEVETNFKQAHCLKDRLGYKQMDQKRFLSQAIGDETLIYDQETQVYHSLSDVAVAIQGLHNEGVEPELIQNEIAQGFPVHAGHAKELVAETLAELKERGLLEDVKNVLSMEDYRMGRRNVLKIAGVTILATVAASVPAAAASGPLVVTQGTYFHNSAAASSCGGPLGTTSVVNGNVTTILNNNVTDNPGSSNLTFTVSDAFFGGLDPCNKMVTPGCQNRLNISYNCKGAGFFQAFCEGAMVSITCP